jgi:hypothetical protein
VEDRSDCYLGSLDWDAGWVLGEPRASTPHGVLESVTDLRS